MTRALFSFFLMLIVFSGNPQQPKLMLPIGHTERVVSAKFSPDGKMAITVSTDGTAKLWETESGKLLKDFKSGGDASLVLVTDAAFTPDGKRVSIDYEGTHTKIYDIRSGKLLDYLDINGKTSTTMIGEARFSPDGKRILLGSGEKKLWVCDFETLKTVFVLPGHKQELTDYQYSNDGKKILTVTLDSTIRIWNAVNGQPLSGFIQIRQAIWSANFSPDSKKIFIETEDGSLQILDGLTGKQLQLLEGGDTKKPTGINPILVGPLPFIKMSDRADNPASIFSPDGHLWIKLYGYYNNYDGKMQISYWDSLVVRDIRNGKLLYTLDSIEVTPGSSLLSNDGKKIFIARKDPDPHIPSRNIYVLDALTGAELFHLDGSRYPINTFSLSTDEKKIVTASQSNAVKIWDAENGKLLSSLKDQPASVNDVRFSPDDKKIITASEDKTARTWDIAHGKPLVEMKGQTISMLSANYDSSGKKIIITTDKKKLVWDIENALLSQQPGIPELDSTDSHNWHTDYRGGTVYSPDSTFMLVWMLDIMYVTNTKTEDAYQFWNEEKEIRNDVQFSPDYKKLLVTSANNTIKLYDIETARPIFTFIAMNNTDFLITDSSNRYDGTDAARKLLHFACGSEVIGLEQVKDQLWVPNLGQRIVSGEKINAKTLNELGICGLTPLVEQGKGLANEILIKIKPRNGGLGETIVSFNGTPTLTIQPSQLKKTGGSYELHMMKSDLKGYFVEGQENNIAIKSYTASNTASSRPISIIEDPDKEKRLPPNLYAVMVGVSDYKGDVLDLDYASIDANDISKTLGDAAKKLLGNDHVFIYNLTTEKERYLLPEKKSIQAVFREIGTKANPNDILFIFLSGHGVIAEKNKQYYYLTADASSAADESSFADVGISTAELTEWIKPQNIKAQKRILIFDACYSGQAINKMVTIGDGKQGFLAARGDDKSQQLRAIDKLNEKSGLFILSASSSNQRAWESGVYSHGYLTYSLLKAIKLQPDILQEGKFLDVGRWLDAAGESVSEMAKGDGSKQQPQIVSSTNFTIGVVDEEITGSINLSETKALFTSGIFFNSNEDIADDDLGLRKLADKQLETLSRAEAGNKIFFLPSTNSTDAWSLTGSYTVKENSITIKVKLKQAASVKQQFELNGTKDKLNDLVHSIIDKALEWMDSNK